MFQQKQANKGFQINPKINSLNEIKIDLFFIKQGRVQIQKQGIIRFRNKQMKVMIPVSMVQGSNSFGEQLCMIRNILRQNKQNNNEKPLFQKNVYKYQYQQAEIQYYFTYNQPAYSVTVVSNQCSFYKINKKGFLQNFDSLDQNLLKSFLNKQKLLMKRCQKQAMILLKKVYKQYFNNALIDENYRISTLYENGLQQDKLKGLNDILIQGFDETVASKINKQNLYYTKKWMDNFVNQKYQNQLNKQINQLQINKTKSKQKNASSNQKVQFQVEQKLLDRKYFINKNKPLQADSILQYKLNVQQQRMKKDTKRRTFIYDYLQDFDLGKQFKIKLSKQRKIVPQVKIQRTNSDVLVQRKKKKIQKKIYQTNKVFPQSIGVKAYKKFQYDMDKKRSYSIRNSRQQTRPFTAYESIQDKMMQNGDLRSELKVFKQAFQVLHYLKQKQPCLQQILRRQRVLSAKCLKKFKLNEHLMKKGAQYRSRSRQMEKLQRKLQAFKL